MATRLFPEQRDTLETLLGALSAGLPAQQGLSTLMSTIEDARAEQEQRQEMKRARRTARTERIGSFQDLIVQRASEGVPFTDVAEEIDILGNLAGLGNRADRELGRSLHTVFPGAGTPGHVEGSPGGISPLAQSPTSLLDSSDRDVITTYVSKAIRNGGGHTDAAASMMADLAANGVEMPEGYEQAVLQEAARIASELRQSQPSPQRSQQPAQEAPPPQPSAGQSAGDAGGGAFWGALLGKFLPRVTGPIGAAIGAAATGGIDERPRTDLSTIPPAVRAAITKVQQARQQASPRTLDDLLG